MQIINTLKRGMGIAIVMLVLSAVGMLMDTQTIFAAALNTVTDVDETFTIRVGESLPLEAEGMEVTWRSADRKVATVAEDGTVTGVRSGSTIVRATIVDHSKIEVPDKWKKGTVLRLYSREAKTMKYYKIVVKKTFEDLNPEMPADPSEADTYYWSNSEDVLQVVDADQSKEMMSEAEVDVYLKQRGFSEYEIVREYDIPRTGTTADYPMYRTDYVSETGLYWSIFVVDGCIYANPASFNLESDLSAPVLFSEYKELTSYDDETNKFYITIPKEDAVIVKVVDTINAETLDQFTMEEIARYENN